MWLIKVEEREILLADAIGRSLLTIRGDAGPEDP